MKRSTKKILTTHVGSLPDLAALDKNAADYEARLHEAVAAVVKRQREIGIDIVNEGEYTKGGDWLSYVEGRFGGFEERPPAGGKPLILQGQDREEFADFYQYATERGTLFYEPNQQIRLRRPHWVCTAPDLVSRARRRCSAKSRRCAPRSASPEDAFLTTTAPASLEPYRSNEFYKTEEEFVFALAEAMRAEYETIADAGFLLQIDDAWLPALWDRIGIDDGARRVSQALHRCGSRRSTTRSPTFPRSRSAIICAGAVGTARTPTTSR